MAQHLSFTTTSAAQTQALGMRVGSLLQAGDTLILSGELGCGKTQFTKGVARAWGVTEEVTSPTFTIQMVYAGTRGHVHHFDLYRLKGARELEDTGIFDALEDDGPCLIEWGEAYADALKNFQLTVEFSRVDPQPGESEPARSLIFMAHDERGEQIIAALSQASDVLDEPGVSHQTKVPLDNQYLNETCITEVPKHNHTSPLFDIYDTSTKDAPHAAILLDTSTDQLVVGLATRDEATGELTYLASRDHLCRRQANVELTQTMVNLMAEHKISMSQVSQIIVGRGPGSFTGVRIAIATAKGLACGKNCALKGVSTLDTCAWTAWEAGLRGHIAVVQDAMRHEIYPGIYILNDEGIERTFTHERVVSVDSCIQELASFENKETLILCGNALTKYEEKFREAGFTCYADSAYWNPTTRGMVHAANNLQKSPESLQTQDPALVLPIYTRLSDAEEAERKRLGLKAPKVQTTGVAEALAGRHIQLRPMSINDVEQVAALEETTYKNANHTAWTKAQFTDELMQKTHTWWIAHDMGKVIGFAGGRLAGDDFEILEVVVDALHRRKGVAQRLMQRICYDAHMFNAQTTSLEVEENNLAAQTLYRKLGYTLQGKRPHYYGQDISACLMSTTLPLVSLQAQPQHPVDPAASLHAWPLAPQERTQKTQDKLKSAGALILAIESSCDETAMAIIDAQGHLCARVVATSLDFHARFGGVVPEIASRKHVEALVGVYEEVMAQAGAYFGCNTLMPDDLSAVGVTAGPGLVGALVVGVAFAKGLCAAANLKLTAVHHLEGHLMANLIAEPQLQPPFLASLVSGGNTMLVLVKAWGDYEILGSTIDDAVGEAFDKVAKALGLGYPGGPVITKLAETGNPKAIAFPRALMHSHGYDFSLSGLKTAVITYIQRENQEGRALNLPDLAASFEAAVFDVQVAKAVAAARQTGVKVFCLGGGVAANKHLHEAYQKAFSKEGIRLIVPPLWICGDNAAMIALVALRNARGDLWSDLSLDAHPNATLGTWSCHTPPCYQP